MKGDIVRTLPNFADELQTLLEMEDTHPPVESWAPSREGVIDIVIKPDGTWWFQNERMTRESTIRLFSRILRKDGDEYYLVTPVERLKIGVEHLPFVVRMMDVQVQGSSQELVFSTNVGDTFKVSKEHVLSMRSGSDGKQYPVVNVRRNLYALISRPVYYELAELLVESADSPGIYGVWSTGEFFELS